MALVVTNNGEQTLLEYAVKTASPGGLQIDIYKNNATPDATSTDYTSADFFSSGGGAVTLDRTGWSSATTDGTGSGKIVYGTSCSWDATADGTAYGYWVALDGSASQVIWAERFDTAKVVSNGESITITPQITLRSAN